MAKKIIRKAVQFVSRDVSVVEKVENKENSVRDQVASLGMALDFQKIEFEVENEVITVGDAVISVNEDYYVFNYMGEAEILPKVIDVVRKINRMVRDHEMKPVERRTSVNMALRRKLIKQRSKVLKDSMMSPDAPTEKMLREIEEKEAAIEEANVGKQLEDEEDLTEEEIEALDNFIIEYSQKDDTSPILAVSTEKTVRKEIEQDIPLTPALEEQLMRFMIGGSELEYEREFFELDLDRTVSAGEAAIMLIDQKEEEEALKVRLEEAKKSAIRHMLYGAENLSESSLRGLGLDCLADVPMADREEAVRILVKEITY